MRPGKRPYTLGERLFWAAIFAALVATMYIPTEPATRDEVELIMGTQR